MSITGPREGEYAFAGLLAVPEALCSLIDASLGPNPLLASKEIVLQDAGLTATLLQAVTTLSPGRIDSARPVSSSLFLFSLPAIRNLALEMGRFYRSFDLEEAEVAMLVELHRANRATAAAADCLADVLSYPFQEEARCCGLLLNVGRLALFSRNPVTYAKELSGCNDPDKIRSVEQAIFGMDHGEAGLALIADWKLDSFLADAVRFLFQPPELLREASQLVRIARLAHEIGNSPCGVTADIEERAKELFGLRGDESDVLFTAVGRLFKEHMAFSREEAPGRFRDAERTLVDRVFKLAVRENLCARLGAAGGLAGLAAEIGQIYRASFPVRGCLLLACDREREMLQVVPTSDLSRMAADLAFPMHSEASSLVANALLAHRPICSLEIGDLRLPIIDQQLLRICGSPGFAVFPLHDRETLLGCLIFAVDEMAAYERLKGAEALALLEEIGAALAGILHREAAMVLSPGINERVPRLVHELGSPLATIGNYLALARDRFEAKGDHTDSLDAIEAEVRRIGEILDYFAGNDAGDAIRTAPYQLSELTAQALAGLEASLLKRCGVKVVAEFDPQLPAVEINPLPLRQILANLVKNAAEALPPGGEILVRGCLVRTADGETEIELTVHDHGPGIPPAVKDRLFRPVASTKGDGHAGLGLSIVKEMVDGLGGTIRCRSFPGHGTTFSVLIPFDAEGSGRSTA